MATRDTAETSDLRAMFAVVRRRKWIIFLTTLITLSSAVLFSYLQTPLYKADGRLVVSPVGGGTSEASSPANLSTEAALLASEAVALRVIEDLELDMAVETLLDDLEVVPSSEGSEVLAVAYVAAERELAAEVANSFLTNYLEFKRDQTRDALAARAEPIEARLTALQTQLIDLAGEIQAARQAGDDNLANTLDAQRSTLIARLGLLQQRLDDLHAAAGSGGGDVIDRAETPKEPFSPNYVRAGALGLSLGLLLGVGLAFLFERLADRLGDRAEIERALDLPILSVIPVFRPEPKGKPLESVLLREPHAPASEAFRNLRTSVDFLLRENALKSLLVTSPHAGEGKTLMTVNLAAAMAESGKRVIVLSADMRRPRLERFFRGQSAGSGNDDAGLSTWLSGGNEDLRSLIRRTDIPNVALMGSGPVPQNPAQLLASPRLQELLDVLERSCDILLTDSPPVLAVTDAAIIGTRSDACFLVIDPARSRRTSARRAVEELRALNVPLLGVVLNAVAPDAASYSPYYQSYAPSPQARGAGTAGGRLKSVFSRR